MYLVYLTNGKQIITEYVHFEENVCLIGDACYSSSLIDDVILVTEEDCWKHI